MVFPVTVSFSETVVVVAASALPENPGCLPPALIRNSPASAIRFPFSGTTDNRRGASVNETVFLSFGLSLIRLTPSSEKLRLLF